MGLAVIKGDVFHGARSDKRRRFSLHEHGFFPREGVGECLVVVALSRVSRTVLN